MFIKEAKGLIKEAKGLIKEAKGPYILVKTA